MQAAADAGSEEAPLLGEQSLLDALQSAAGDREAYPDSSVAEQPIWNPARFVGSTQLAPGIRRVAGSSSRGGGRARWRVGTRDPWPLGWLPACPSSVLALMSAPSVPRHPPCPGSRACRCCCCYCCCRREVVLASEITQEMVPLLDAGKLIGQRASVRVTGASSEVPLSGPPFPPGLLPVRKFGNQNNHLVGFCVALVCVCAGLHLQCRCRQRSRGGCASGWLG